MVKLFNAFSLQMIDDMNATVTFKIIDVDTAAKILKPGFTSFVGHGDTAKILGNMLNLDVPFNRTFGKIDKGDTAIVAQVVGGRLPEGATKLPDGMKMVFILVNIGD